ncbi:MAG: response regulator [Candidatus Eiseniibacteriota bacterium]|jgi:DNA-binding response OmpR family regulator
MPQHPRILLVDDDPLTCDLVARRLERDDYRVTTAMCVDDGLRVSAEEEPDLVLLDAELVNGDAAAFARHPDDAPAAPATPIILMTGGADDPGDWQAAGLIAKPFSPDQLLATIRAVLDRHAA